MHVMAVFSRFGMFKLLLFLSFFLMIGDASAQVVTYDRAADFLAVIEPDVLIDFEEIEAPSDQSYTGGYEASGVLIFASDNYMYVRNYNAASNGYLYGADRERQTYVQIDLPSGSDGDWCQRHYLLHLRRRRGEGQLVFRRGVLDQRQPLE